MACTGLQKKMPFDIIDKEELSNLITKSEEMMNTFQLNCFLAVAHTLNFARAAKQMNISQPAITNQIKMLEKELNAKLFNRSTRRVELTPEGEVFLGDAKNIVALSERAKLRFSNPDRRPIETLGIGCSSFMQIIMLTDILTKLAVDRPNLHPRLYVVPHEQLFQLLDAGTADVLFDIQGSEENKERVTFRELYKSPLVCVCSMRHILAQRESIAIQELAEENLIFCDPVYLAPDLTKLQWQLAEGRNPADIHFCGTIEAAIVLASAGFGIAILPELVVPQEAQVVSIPIEGTPKLAFGMFYKPYPGDGVLKQFIQITRRSFELQQSNIENGLE